MRFHVLSLAAAMVAVAASPAAAKTINVSAEGADANEKLQEARQDRGAREQRRRAQTLEFVGDNPVFVVACRQLVRFRAVHATLKCPKAWRGVIRQSAKTATDFAIM